MPLQHTIAVFALLFCLAPAGAQQARPSPPRIAVTRDQLQSRGRSLPGFSAAALRHRAVQQKLRMRAAQLSAASASGGWLSLGPLPLPSDASGIGLQDYGFVSGRATAVAIDPNDLTGNTVYVGAAYGGVWRSAGAGPASVDPASVGWTPLTDDQPTLAIGALAVQPLQADPSQRVVLAGTGETNSAADSYYGLGILRSADAGQTWNLISQDAAGHPFAGLGFSQISFSTKDHTVAVAAATSTSLGIIEGKLSPSNSNVGLYYSTDSGSTWSLATINDAGQSLPPSSVSSVVYNAAAGTFYAAVRFHGFYSSTDNGLTWTRLVAQPGPGLSMTSCPAQTSQACPFYRAEIAVVPNRTGPSKKGEMYVWFVDANDADQGIWKTLDGGVTWAQIDDSGITNCGDLFGGCGTSQGRYNLALAAVPNGNATDLYAGATNLYKCTITSLSPNCGGSGSNTFLNLTHVYGCSDIAKVHPDQHAIDFLVANGASLLFFAGDGGIYRALDGFTGLTTGTCGLSNRFDSLNASLGPLTQFISIAQSSTNPDLIFGGTQDNGAPASTFAQTGGPWSSVYAGDVGFTAINPADDNDWFIAVPPDSISGTTVLHCTAGMSCHAQDFDQVASSAQLGGDQGAFYAPFLFDPANSSDLLVGTCRIWSGNRGGSFSLLSPNFEVGGSTTCSGAETNLVRSLAVGGPIGPSGNAQVIYAGTDGLGPHVAVSPAGGHVWITTVADSGPPSWSDRTGAINSSGFPISSIAIDASDSSGSTAYLTIMGFHTSHVWKTIDAGTSWTDFTGNLPDAPVNSIVIDLGSSGIPGTLFVGTDVGVFSSSTASPNWTEVGFPGSYIPNVAVTSLKIFHAAGLKRLRATTYGRGIWEWDLVTTPDFQLSVSNNPQTVFAGQTATYNATLWSRNGYASAVNLACAAGTSAPPSQCSASPSSVSPAVHGSAFSISAGGSVGDYAFDLKAAGTDSATITHKLGLTLHIVDFAISTPSPARVSVSPGSTSGSVSFAVSAAGSFSSSVALSCAGLPMGASCQFQPSSVVTPTSATSVPVTLIVATSSSTPLGSSTVTINAVVANGAKRSQNLSLIVGSAPDYSLAITNPSLTTAINSPGTFNGTVTSINGYNSAVALSCGAGAPPSCAVNPPSLTPISSGTSFTVTVQSSGSRTYPFTIDAIGSDPGAIAHSLPLTFTASPSASSDFTLSASPSSATVSAGASTQFTVDVAPTTSTFPADATFTCSGLPALSSCLFSPQQVAAGSGETLVSLAISTTAPVRSALATISSVFFLPICGLMNTRKSRRVFVALCLLAFSTLLLSCGGGLQGNSMGGSGSPGTPAGSYDITITATSAGVTHSTHVTLTVK